MQEMSFPHHSILDSPNTHKYMLAPPDRKVILHPDMSSGIPYLTHTYSTLECSSHLINSGMNLPHLRIMHHSLGRDSQLRWMFQLEEVQCNKHPRTFHTYCDIHHIMPDSIAHLLNMSPDCCHCNHSTPGHSSVLQSHCPVLHRERHSQVQMMSMLMLMSAV